ncbi:uncharacterized protein BJ171DRAFT_570190 [Polychytrium aggregatum]|uniref:uncharacterized protein n=1 Tax=Polychytrium aggregatum TaxID=110093 RepID=UPI0022FDD675|nr:uncharacterized protein BJ171DRAFT_570190 [Polychytrium aggregatum]KAI9199823.1 hypothetical protein BJ171DRAFT_570190 [Polychytrium aggregatum]
MATTAAAAVLTSTLTGIACEQTPLARAWAARPPATFCILRPPTRAADNGQADCGIAAWAANGRASPRWEIDRSPRDAKSKSGPDKGRGSGDMAMAVAMSAPEEAVGEGCGGCEVAVSQDNALHSRGRGGAARVRSGAPRLATRQGHAPMCRRRWRTSLFVAMFSTSIIKSVVDNNRKVPKKQTAQKSVFNQPKASTKSL